MQTPRPVNSDVRRFFAFLMEVTMKHRIIFSFLLTMVACSVGYSQQARARKYVVAPADIIFLTVAAQPECPLKIKNARMLLSIDGGPTFYQYRLVNRGRKPIHYFTVVAWHLGGTGGTLTNPAPWDGRITKRLVMPGHIVPTDKLDPDMEIVPLTPELRTKLKLDGSTRHVTVLLVDHIRFADESVYDNRKTSEALAAYFEKFDP
jgi:hypothetical protein